MGEVDCVGNVQSSWLVVNEQFEFIFNAVSPSAVILRLLLNVA